MKILAFAGSNSSTSINKRLVTYASSLIEGGEVRILDLNDFEMPIFSIDRENANGVPGRAKVFANHIDEADLLLISLAEHNGNYSVAFKNIFDWVSRIKERSVFNDKPIFLMGTSPGGRGAKSVLQIAEDRFPRNGGRVLDTFSLPKFKENFNDQSGITDPEKKKELQSKLDKIVKEVFA